MSKRPSFQFYPPDWRNDAGLRLCSSGARGLWIDMLCLMHEGEPYGHLTVFGRPVTVESLAKLVGESGPAVKRWLGELAANEVYSQTDDGVIFSRRMVRDEELRDLRAKGGPAGAEHGAKGGRFGALGGRPRKDKAGSGEAGTGDKKPPLEPPPSSSSPSSEGSEDKSSGADGAEPDLDKVAWDGAVKVLVTQGSMTDKAARALFGKLLAENRLRAKDALPAVSGAQVCQTKDPQGYLTRALKGVSGRIPANAPAKRVGFV